MSISARLVRQGARMVSIVLAVMFAALLASTPSFAGGGEGHGSFEKAIPVVKVVPVVEEVPVTQAVLVPVRVRVVRLVPVVRRVTTFRQVTTFRRVHMAPRTRQILITSPQTTCQPSSNDMYTRCTPPHGSIAAPQGTWYKNVPVQAATQLRIFHVTQPVTRNVVTFRRVVTFKTVLVRRLITVFKPITVLKQVVVVKNVPIGGACCSCECGW